MGENYLQPDRHFQHKNDDDKIVKTRCNDRRTCSDGGLQRKIE